MRENCFWKRKSRTKWPRPKAQVKVDATMVQAHAWQTEPNKGASRQSWAWTRSHSLECQLGSLICRGAMRRGAMWLFQSCGNRIYSWSLGNQMHWTAKYPLNLLLNQLKLCKYSTNFSNMSANYSKMCFFANFPKVNNNKIWYLFLCRMTNRATRFICPLKLI